MTKITGRQLKDYDLAYVLKTAAPTPTDDGYSVPYLWVDISADRAYLLVDNAAGNATWDPIGGGITALLDWQASVKSIADCTAAPPTETLGDRYILDSTSGTVHANWDGASKLDIVEFDGVSWDAITPNEGFACWVDDEDIVYVFNGTAWVKLGTFLTHNNLLGRSTADAHPASSIGSYKQTDIIPIEWALNGATPPDAAETISSGSGEMVVRKFSGTASQNVRIPWPIPHGIVAADGVKFRAVCAITESTAPSTEGISFKLSGYSIADDESINGFHGSEVESKKTGMSHAQYDLLKTDLSDVVTIANLDSGEVAMLNFYRDHDDSDDTYAQKVGVSAVTLQFSTKMSDSWKY